MRFSLLSAVVVALAADTAVASTWFGKAAYNKWHETELERWLTDHNIPHPKAADRKDLENLVKDNWESNVMKPYNEWSVKQLSDYLASQGQQVKKGAEQNKDALVNQVKSSWYETEDQANEGYFSVKNWIFDTWTDSQLKAFLDKHNIPNPQPRTRDSLLSAARANYEATASTVGETAAYPGNWLWAHWSDSDLKAWLDERGYYAPQANERDQLIAAVRRNSRLASQQVAQARKSAQSNAEKAAKEAKKAQEQWSDKIIQGWSDSQFKAWADSNGINIPQGSKKNEMIALVRKQRSKLDADAKAASKSASSVMGSVTGQFAAATDSVWGIVDQVKKALLGASVDATSGASSATKKAASATKKAKQEL
jgi:hypothetical protein